jgi:hypothetical protein
VNPGIPTEYVYPYTSFFFSAGHPDKPCQNISEKLPRFSISDFEAVPKGDCRQLKLSLQKMPISVALSGFKLAFYCSGVFDNCATSDPLDHAALLVGFKKDKGWKIKNSWGPAWG